MPRDESDREDLLREATALVERVELTVPDEKEPIVAGFRRGGDVSIFFGADPVYQFHSDGGLRRAFVAGQLYRAARGRLDRLTRERTGDATLLLRHSLTDSEATELLSRMQGRLDTLRRALEAEAYQLVGQVSESGDVVTRLRAWLSTHGSVASIAQSARVGGR